MHIGIDSRNLIRRLSGISRMVSISAGALAKAGHRVTLFAPSKVHNDFVDLTKQENVTIIEDNADGPFGRILWGSFDLRRHVETHKPDVFWAPAHRLAPGLAKLVPTVLTIHDVVWKIAPQTMPLRRMLGEQILSRRALKAATRILTVSETTKKDLLRFYPFAADKVHTVVNMSDHSRQDTSGATLPFKGPFMLFVGTLEPRKNIERLVQAFCLIPATEREGFKLVLAGALGWKAEPILAAIESEQDSVVWLRDVDEGTLAALYDHCEFVVMPSLYEGFGYSIVEAETHGKPVIVSRDTALVEIASPVATTIDPYDEADISRGIRSSIAHGSDVSRAPLRLEHTERYRPANVLPQLLEQFQLAVAEYSA